MGFNHLDDSPSARLCGSHLNLHESQILQIVHVLPYKLSLEVHMPGLFMGGWNVRGVRAVTPTKLLGAQVKAV